MTPIYCNCGSYVGKWTPATHDQPGEADCGRGVITDSNGIPFCSEACYREVHPYICAGCKDAAVDTKQGICKGCRESEPGDWIHLDDYLAMKTLADLSDAIALVREKRVA